MRWGLWLLGWLTAAAPAWAGDAGALADALSALYDDGAYGEAVAQGEAGLAEVAAEGTAAELSEVKFHLGLSHLGAGGYERAAELLSDVWAFEKETLGAEHEDPHITARSLARALYGAGDVGGAVLVLEDTLAVSSVPADRASSLVEIADLYVREGRVPDAIAALDEAATLPLDDDEVFKVKLARINVSLASGALDAARADVDDLVAFAESLDGPMAQNRLWTALDTAATVAQRAGDVHGAAALRQQALDERRATLGDEHPDVVTSMGNLGMTYIAVGDYARADATLQEAYVLARKVFGADHPNIATLSYHRATVRRRQNDWAGALPLDEEVLAARLHLYGPDHVLVGQALLAVAEDKARVGRAEEAIADLEEAERVLASMPVASPVQSQRRVALARALREVGRISEMEAVMTEHLDVLRGVAPRSPEVCVALVERVRARLLLYDLEGAEADLAEAIEIGVEVWPADNPNLAALYQQSSILLATTGDYHGAARDAERALELTRARLGDQHEFVANSLSALANAHHHLGDLVTARNLRDEVVSLRRSVAPSSAELPTDLLNLASTDLELGDGLVAFALLDDAEAQARQVWAPEHPNWRTLYDRRCSALMLLDRAAEAVDACGAAVTAWSRFGSWSDDGYPSSLLHHVDALGKAGQLDAASAQLAAVEERLLAEPPRPTLATPLLATRVAVAARRGDWGAAVAAVEAVRADGVPITEIGAITAMVAVHHPDPVVGRRWTEDALAATMARLDSVAGASSERLRISAASRNSATIGAYLTTHTAPEDARLAYEWVLRWKGQGRAGGGLPERGLADDDAALLARLDDVRRYIAAITLAPQADAERARDTLARLTREKEGLELRLGSVSDRVASRAQLRAVTPAAVCAALDDGTALVDTFAYRQHLDADDAPALVAAFVMVGGACDRVHRVELGSESEVAADVARWRQLLAAHDVAARVDPAGARVRARVWDPLVPVLGDADRVVMVPDASLATLPFPALPVGRGRYLVEDVAFVFAEHAIELTRPWRARAVAAGDEVDALLVGGVAYTGVTARSRAACSGTGFGPLPGTAGEVEQIGAFFGRRAVRRLDGVGATERSVREAMAGARVVHLATHGFFSEATCDGDPPRDARSDGLNPMVLSGLVLAPDASDDGLLTAEELRSADLSAAQLVVLSACSSGLGSIRPGEGVMGLRRALSMAGAGSVVMSLWSVDDLATRDLMVDLYDALGKRQEQRAPSDALRRAQLDALARARATRGDGDPGQWGAFVATGR